MKWNRIGLPLAILGLALSFPAAADKKVFVSSGGGIRAAIGTDLALALLHGQSRIKFDEYHALSGGSWGLAMSMFSQSPTWCEAIKQSLKAEKGKLDPRRLKQTSNVKFGPRSATNPFSKDIEWWNYWKANVISFTNAKTGALPTLPGRGNLFVHVAQLLKSNGEQNKGVNDCWFTNKVDDFRCLFDAANPKAGYSTAGATPVIYRTNSNLVTALTYSSAAWSTLQAKDGVKGAFRQKCPLLQLKPALSIELTDGGDFMNLPLMSVVNDFHLNPQNTQVLAFDFTEPDEGTQWGKPPMYDVRFALGQLKARSPFRNVQETVIDRCQAKLVYKKGAHTLTIHVLGFCGPATHPNGAHTLINTFRTIEFNAGVGAGKGIAKQWDKDELDQYTKAYGAFLADRLSPIAKAEFRYLPHFSAPGLCNPY